ncbi:hypothetical protein OTU49_010768 [Cherax quadricarinatus]|uniref:Copper transport protein n=1 Tax=Cherax quadricarinatus TaxID=27406 RepID=A0AAW0WE05_CHEQU
MHMSYYFSSTVYDFLFKGVNIITTWGMVSLCLGLVSLSVLAEGFKVARSQLLKVAASRKTGCNKYDIPERVKFHILQSFLHILHLTVGYILMLVVMTYNAYFTIAVVVGAGLGYFFFAVFDLPSRVLGTYYSTLPKVPTNSTQGSEGNSCIRSSYGTAETVPSSVVLRPASELEQFSRNIDSMDLAFENVGHELNDSGGVHGQCEKVAEVDSLLEGPLDEDCGEKDIGEGSISDTTHLLPQETIKVEVQVHAYPEE